MLFQRITILTKMEPDNSCWYALTITSDFSDNTVSYHLEVFDFPCYQGSDLTLALSLMTPLISIFPSSTFTIHGVISYMWTHTSYNDQKMLNDIEIVAPVKILLINRGVSIPLINLLWEAVFFGGYRKNLRGNKNKI